MFVLYIDIYVFFWSGDMFFFPKPGQYPPSCLEGWGDVTYDDSSARMKRVEEGSQMMELETVYIYIYFFIYATYWKTN